MSVVQDRETARKEVVLIVDDTPDNIALLTGLLKNKYRVIVATNGLRALEIVRATLVPDLILLDIVMPGLDGYQTCERLKTDPDTADIPIIFLTAKNEVGDEAVGFDLGAVDYITKPISPLIVLARIDTHLALSRSRKLLKNQNKYLEELVEERTLELERTQDAILVALASLAETRDNDTGSHIRRTQHYVVLLALSLRNHERFRGFLTEDVITLLFKTAPLHDIGKVGVPDAILLKRESLTPEEFEVMKRHTILGRDAILAVESNLGRSTEFLRLAQEFAYSHQEKWDGSGYPQGLSGDNIPLAARLMAVADVYDSLISERPYKPASSHAEAIEIMKEGRGKDFDPDILDAFLGIEGEFRWIAKRFRDGVLDLEPESEPGSHLGSVSRVNTPTGDQS
jgi:putative two-component system response regulator